jgi:hypothetical protein
VSVSLLDRARELNIDFGFEPFESLVKQIERLRYVDHVEDGHQFWARIEPETSNPAVATRRVERVLMLIERALARAKKAE